MSDHGSSLRDTQPGAAGSSSKPFGVRRTRYGRVPYEVVKIVKETAKTHTFRDLNWKGEWGRDTLVRGPFIGTRFSSVEVAHRACSAGNDAWALYGGEVAAAQVALTEARELQRSRAAEAVALIAGEGLNP